MEEKRTAAETRFPQTHTNDPPNRPTAQASFDLALVTGDRLFTVLTPMFVLSLFVLVAVLASASAAADSTMVPGRIYLWSWSDKTPSFNNQYVTKSLKMDTAVSHVADLVNDFEVVVILKPSEAEQSSQFVQHSVQHAPTNQIMNYVYPTSTEKISETLSQALSENKDFTIHRKPLTEVESTLHAHPNMLSDGKVDVFEAPITSDHDVVEFSLRSRALMGEKQKILFVSYDEPKIREQSVKVATKALPRGQYARYLAATSDIIDGKYYKPEGGEYSIYYGSQYLYITPDIFTGLMTGLFYVFVLITGLSCLGSIQGMSSFYDKLPAVGREA